MKTALLYALLLSGLLCFPFVLAENVPYQKNGASPPEDTIELTHWLVSPGEQLAVDVIRKAVEARGLHFVSSEYQDYDILRVEIVERMQLGYSPTATQWLAGDDLAELVKADVLYPFPSVWRGKPLETFLFPEIYADTSIDGKHLTSLPVGIHIDNATFYNAGIYKQLKLPLPNTWDEFLQQAETIRAAGYLPIALSNDQWQLTRVFWSMLLEYGGDTAFLELNRPHPSPDVLNPAITQVMERLTRLRPYGDHKDHLKWNEATNLVANGKAAMQVMGDFAKPELTLQHKQVDRDYYCRPSLGNPKALIYSIDVFAMFRSESSEKSQQTLFDLILDPKVQRDYIAAKGGIPVRKDIDIRQLDECARTIYEAWLNPHSTHLSYPTGHIMRKRLAAMQSVLDNVWQDQSISAQKAHELFIQVLDNTIKLEVTSSNPENEHSDKQGSY